MGSELKIAHGMGIQPRKMREVSEGVHPRLSLKVAPYLPIKEIRYQGDQAYPIVMYAGELVAVDQWNQLVPANCGTAATFVYSQNDVDWSVPRFDNAVAYGRGATATDGLSVASLGNNVVGYAYTDYVSTAPADKYLNYEIQTATKTICTDYVISLPVTNSTQALARQGQTVIPDAANPGKWRTLVAADVDSFAELPAILNNIVGKVLKVEKITDHLLKSELIQGAPGLSLPGTIDTAGINNFLSGATTQTMPDNNAASTSADKYYVTILVRI